MSEKEGFYTPSQVTKTLSIPPSTLRRYCTNYGQHLSESANVAGKKRSFSERDLRLLSEIRRLTSQRKSKKDVDAALSVFDPDADIPDDPRLDLIPATRVQAMIERIETGVRDIQMDVREQRDMLSEQRNMLDDYSSRLTTLEQEWYEWSRLPWWRKLFRRKPRTPF